VYKTYVVDSRSMLLLRMMHTSIRGA